MLDIDKLISHLRQTTNENKNLLNEKELKQVINAAKEILLEESNVQPVQTPVNICGDIHGQFYDLLELFKTGGELPHQKYIFIGDFVDRGYNSVETMEYLLCLKVKYPNQITLLRGNHESRNITMAYGFYEEICRKYGNSSPWRLFCELFDCLPIGALVDNKIFCVHGGLSKAIVTIDQIRTIDRRQEIPMEGPYADLMWSDPDDVQTWAPNMRGAGWLFGDKVVSEFNHINGLDLICRAHQLVLDGHLYWFDERLVTVWSAPNYCYRMRNKATILSVNEQLQREFKDFVEVPESSKTENPKKVLPYFL